MTLTIEAMRGVWRAQLDSRTYFADTLEELLLILAPDAPEDYVWHAAEVLGAILGAEVVELPAEVHADGFGEELPFSAVDAIGALYGDFFEEGDDDVTLNPLDPETEEKLRERHGLGFPSWQPTKEQQAYFEQKRSLVDELLEERRQEAARENEDDGA